MSNNEDLLKETINAAVVDLLETMKSINPDDRFAVLEEMGSWIYDDINLEDELLVPDLDVFLNHG